MKRIFKINLAIMYCLTVFLLSSCQEEQLEEQEQPVQFSFNAENLSEEGKVADIDDIQAIVITVKDASGTNVLEMEKIALYNVNGSFVSEPVALKPGDYKLTHFMVVDGGNKVLYISPKEGSDKAPMVSDPLPIAFQIIEGETTDVGVSVVRVQESPEAYGYVSFTLSIEGTVVFKVAAFEFNFFTNEEPHLVPTGAHIEVFLEGPSGEKIFEGTVKPEVNTYEIPDHGSTPIHIKITKPNYHPFGETFSRAELEAFCDNPLEVVLDTEDPFMPILKTKHYIGPQYIHSEAPNTLLYNSDKGVYKIDISDIENPGDPVLVQEIQGVAGYKFYEDQYGKLFLRNYVSSDMGESWQLVTGERPISYFVEMNNVYYGLNGRKLYKETGNDEWEFVVELPYSGDLIVFNCRLFAGNGLLVSDDGINFMGTGIPVEDGLNESFFVMGTFTALDKLYMLFHYGDEIGYIYEWTGSEWTTVYLFDAENEVPNTSTILAGEYEDYMVLVEQNSLRIFDDCSPAGCEPFYDYFFVWDTQRLPTYTIWGTLLSGDYVFIETTPDDEGYNYLFAADLSKLELRN